MAFVALGGALLARFVSNSLSGRELIWASLRDVADAYPVFGIGLGHQILVVPAQVTKITTTIAAHDEYLRLSVELGYVGAFVVVSCLVGICALIWCSRRVRGHLVFLSAAVTFFIYCNSDNAISSAVTPFIIVIASFAFPSLNSRAANPAARHGQRRVSTGVRDGWRPQNDIQP
jgi:O-antigen ligase